MHSSQLAQQAAVAYTAAQAKEAERVAEHIQRVEARWFACAADAEAAITDYEGRGQGRRGRKPRLWRYHALHYRVEAVSSPQKADASRPSAEGGGTPGRGPLSPGRAPRGPGPLRGRARVDGPGHHGAARGCTDAEMLQAYQEQHITVEPGFRWIKNPAAISPVWLEKPERIAALAMLTVVGLLVYAVIQRQVRLYLRDHDRHIPGNKGLTATPTAAVVFALFTPVMLVHFAVDNTPSLQVHGVQDYHRIVCDAVGIDQAWYATKRSCSQSGSTGLYFAENPVRFIDAFVDHLNLTTWAFAGHTRCYRPPCR